MKKVKAALLVVLLLILAAPVLLVTLGPPVVNAINYSALDEQDQTVKPINQSDIVKYYSRSGEQYHWYPSNMPLPSIVATYESELKPSDSARQLIVDHYAKILRDNGWATSRTQAGLTKDHFYYIKLSSTKKVGYVVLTHTLRSSHPTEKVLSDSNISEPQKTTYDVTITACMKIFYYQCPVDQ